MSENLPIRVLIVDDHVMIRRGLRSYLLGRSDMAVVGEAGDGEAAVQAVASLRPEVVLLDINMPKLDGIAAAGIIHRQHPSVKILMLTSFQESDLMRAALAAGAAGYLLKDAPEEDLIAAMFTGRKRSQPEAGTKPLHFASPWLALALFAASGVCVWLLISQPVNP